MKKPSEVTVTVMGVEVTVEYTAHGGYRETREEPGEPAHCEIEGIKIGGEFVSDEHLSEKFLEAIQIEVEETVWEPDDYPDPDPYEENFWSAIA